MGIVADVNAKAQGGIYISDGSPQAYISASAEALYGSARVTGGINILGSEVDGSVAVSYGTGAHFNVGLKDGVIYVDIGVALGLGISIGTSFDVGKMVDTLYDSAFSVTDILEDLVTEFLVEKGEIQMGDLFTEKGRYMKGWF